jgi:hypothetical protein
LALKGSLSRAISLASGRLRDLVSNHAAPPSSGRPIRAKISQKVAFSDA